MRKPVALSMLIVVGVGFAVNVGGQAAQPPSDALVSEVRLLRQTIEKIGGQTAQVQLALGRASAAQAAMRDLNARLTNAVQYANSMGLPVEQRQRYQEEVATLQQQIVIEQGRLVDAQKYLEELQRDLRRQ